MENTYSNYILHNVKVLIWSN